jgi:hypothetical protein
MTTFTIAISTQPQLDGISAARAAYNNDNPKSSIVTDQDYVQFVMDRAATSYAQQYGYLPPQGGGDLVAGGNES